MPSHSLLRISVLVLVFVVPALATSALPRCPDKYTPFASHFSIRHELPQRNVPLAYRYLSVPPLLRLLFGSSITLIKETRIDDKPESAYRISDGRGYWASLEVVEEERGLVILEVAEHDDIFFPVFLRGSKFEVRIRGGKAFEISFHGSKIKPTRRLHARNVYARGLAEQMLARVHRVLGSHHCSASTSTVTGLCNNVRYPLYGSAGIPQLRADTDERLTLRDELPNPRAVSDALCKAETESPAPRRINFLMVSFGQFLDHDMILTPSGDSQQRDASFVVSDEPTKSYRMKFFRSDFLSLPKCCERIYSVTPKGTGPFNGITAFVDGSGIYGSSPIRTRALRSFKNGKLIMRRRNGELLLPRNSKRELLYTLNNANRAHDVGLFAAGDVRANENPVLTSLHTIFAREHNRVCNALRAAVRRTGQPLQTDEWLFQQARRVVAAELQSIVYNEFLPAMLGEGALPPYKGYNGTMDATMNLLFTSAAYRWGHSAIRDNLGVRDLDGTTATHFLKDAFFNTSLFAAVGVEKWLLGAMNDSAMNVDLQHADSIRDFLFSPAKRGVLDLVALNIQRGRDHRLPSYLAARDLYGLDRSLDDIPEKEKERLLTVYGSAYRIDAFIGGLAERKVDGSLLGPLFHRIVSDQFRRLRDGDRFFYMNIKWGKFMGRLGIVKRIVKHEVRLADIIKANTRIEDSHMPSGDGAMRTAK